MLTIQAKAIQYGASSSPGTEPSQGICVTLKISESGRQTEHTWIYHDSEGQITKIFAEYGLIFKSDLAGNIYLEAVNVQHNVDISTIGRVNISGMHFKKVNIQAKRIIIAKDFSAESLNLEPTCGEPGLEFCHIKTGVRWQLDQLHILRGYCYNFGVLTSIEPVTICITQGHLKNYGLIESQKGVFIQGRGIFSNFTALKSSLIMLSAKIILNTNLMNANRMTSTASVWLIKNTGEFHGAYSVTLEAEYCDNSNGKMYASDNIVLLTKQLNNDQGNLNGAKITQATVKSNFSNMNGEFGVTGKTILFLKKCSSVMTLGVLKGNVVFLKTIAEKNSILLKNGNIIADGTVTVTGDHVLMPSIYFHTPVLKLQVKSFQLDKQLSCDKTVVEVTKPSAFILKEDYKTAGSFEIFEIGVECRSLETTIRNRREPTLGSGVEEPGSVLSIQASIQAEKGFLIIAPNFKVKLGDTSQKKPVELMAESSECRIYVDEFDIEKGGIAAQNVFLSTLHGVVLGRLIEDLPRQVFATLGTHPKQQIQYALNSHKVNSYKFLNIDYPDIYYQGHLFALPLAVPNGSYMVVKEKLSIQGALKQYGTLEAKDLTIFSDTRSILEASTTQVKQDCSLFGDFLLTSTVTSLDSTYTDPVSKQARSWNGNFCNSEPASLKVFGKLSGNAEIIVKGSILYAKAIVNTVKVNSQDIQTLLAQKIIGGDAIRDRVLQNVERLRNNSSSAYRYVSAARFSPILDHGIYARSFIQRTNNFSGAENVFPSQVSFNSDTILCTNVIQGFFSAPNTLIPIERQSLVLGNQNPYVLNPVSPIHDLLSRGFNFQTTYIAKELKAIIQQVTSPNFYFQLRERFWFDDKSAQDFYHDIWDHVVVVTPQGILKKPDPKTVFALSPQLLMNSVIEATDTVLKRSYIYEDIPMDETLVKRLHQNTTEYLKEQNIHATNFINHCMTARLISRPNKAPLLYYVSYMNEENVEVLKPYICFPQEMIHTASVSGGVFKTNLLIAFPKQLTSKQIIECFGCSETIQESLVQLLDANAGIKEQLDLLMHSEASVAQFSEGVKLYGNYSIKSVGVLTESKLSLKSAINATGSTCLVSVYNDVEIGGSITRGYTGNSNHFSESWVPCRIDTKNDLCIYAGKNILLESIETNSGTKTQMEALGNIIDIPKMMFSQWEQAIHQKNFRRFIQHSVSMPAVSHHHSGGEIQMEALDSLWVQGAVMQAVALLLSGANVVAILPAQQQIVQKNETRTVKKTWYFTNKVKHAIEHQITHRSILPKFDVQELRVMGSQVTINVCSNAKTNTFLANQIHFKQTKNIVEKFEATMKRNAFWQHQSVQNSKQNFYTPSSILGIVQIQAQQVLLDRVVGAFLDLLHKIDQSAFKNIYCDLLSEVSVNKHSISGPSVGLAMLLAAVVATAMGPTAITWGTKLSAVFASQSIAVASGLSAGIVAAGTDAAVALLYNPRHPRQAIENLANKAFIKSLGISMINAGVLKFVMQVLQLPSNVVGELSLEMFKEHFQYQLISASIGLATQAMQKTPANQTIPGTCLKALGETLGNCAAAQIERWRTTRMIGPLIHRGLHSLNAATADAVSGGNRGSIVANAAGAMVGVNLAECLTETGHSTFRTVLLSKLGVGLAGLGSGPEPQLSSWFSGADKAVAQVTMKPSKQ